MLHGYNPPSRYLPYLSWTEVAALPDRENTVICAGVVGHALARLDAKVPAYAMAPITYGKSEGHLHFPGTITLTGETLLATMIEIGERSTAPAFASCCSSTATVASRRSWKSWRAKCGCATATTSSCPNTPGACRTWRAAT